jgi:hypothetical protein
MQEKEILDNWLIDKRAITQQQFRTDMSAYPKAGRKFMWKYIAVMGVIMIATSAFMYSRSDNTPASMFSLVISLSVYAAVVIFGVIRAMKRYKKVFESYLITIDNNGITREQHETPLVSIPAHEIKSIRKRANNTIVITGKSSYEKIVIPAQMERYSEMEMLLRSLHPFELTATPLHERLDWAIGLLSAITLFMIIYMDDKRIVLAGAIITIPLYSWSLVQRLRNKNLAYNSAFSKAYAVAVLLALIAFAAYKLSR